ncbi:hypothetical protein ZQ65_20090 [Salmonella enterica subsp. enterica serovar Newport]|uniref:Leucine-rich repeat domain-containing protein n=1 Tax=Salmonella newport TaxID=108619 RepID=A0A5U9KWG8_SALNE|nr:hypothetical protein [Salmonella enterica subsp. enterica serovar Newport]ECN8542010.1 hypothetical protein [Salmonella enterica subsp. enterica serovar Newport]EJH8886096.1 hypothetical protein [Salmonella enterica]EJY6444827.1 hypothetical protein [Salmonella enterica]EKJ0767589.1 hypothetical protein [Salmonella enterica]
MFDLIKHLNENDIEHTVSDLGNITVTGNLDLRHVSGVDALPDNLTVVGALNLSYTSITNLPDNLTFSSLDLRDTSITNLPDNLTVGEVVFLSRSSTITIPDNFSGTTVFLDA